ncbi:MAG: hypothetical protein ACI4ON_00565 [Clostridia bacterium]
MKKRGLAYIAITIISLGLLVYFIFAPKKYEKIEKIISESNKEIYVIYEETYLFNKPISEWGIIISIIGIITGTALTYIEYTSNKKRTQQEKGAEIAKMFATEIINKVSIIINVISLSKLEDVIKKKESNCNEAYSIFECTNFDKNEIRRIYGEKIYEKYDSLKKEKELQAIYTKVIKAAGDSSYYVSDIKKELNDIKKLKQTNKSNYKKKKKEFERAKLEDNKYILCNMQFPHKFSALVCDTLNELEYLCMYISSRAANSEFIYQSLHQTFLNFIRLLAIEISSNNTNSVDKVYTNIIHVYNDWLNRYSKAKKTEAKNIKKSNRILNPRIETIN